jgi:polyisoprenoid-binding protein YceI
MKASIGLVAAGLAATLGGAAAPAAAAPVRYVMVAPQSRLQFTGTQAGAPFTAVFHRFTAAIDFAPDDLRDSRFDVAIDVGSVDSQDGDRDGTMRGADLFDVAHWPTARYLTRGFTKTATGYAATGTLTLRGVARAVPITFAFTPTSSGATLTGSAQVDRLDFGIGQGDWKSTEWVANPVKIAFSLVLTAKH